MAASTAVDARSASSHHEKPSVNSGAVLTSRTEAATEVNERLAIQVAKCRPSERPEASSTARWRPAMAGHARASEGAAKGATTSEARKMRLKATASAGAWAKRTKMLPTDTQATARTSRA